MLKPLFVFLVICLGTLLLHAQETKNVNTISREDLKYLEMADIANLTLEELMVLSDKLGISMDELLNMQTDLGSMVELTPRETPGIITIVSRDEIVRSGARDLIDVLNLVPGFSFGYDVDGVIGLTSRGNWGHEGKILFLYNGHVINEGMYGVTPLAISFR